MRFRLFSVIAALSLTVSLPCVCAQEGFSVRKPPVVTPVLHADGAQPSEIMNGESATVIFSGAHFTGARVKAEGACALLSYEIADAEIRARIHGLLAIGDKDNHCTFTVTNTAGSASVAVVVELTDEQAEKRDARQAFTSENKVGASPGQERAGKRWEIHFADGTVRVFELKSKELPGNAFKNGSAELTDSAYDGAPSFQDSAGNSIGIVVRPDYSVYLIERGCMRTGNLHEGTVKDGKSLPGCTHGNWTATVR